MEIKKIVYPQRACQYCGTLFDVTDKRKIYCTRLCKDRAIHGTKIYKRTCLGCGQLFETTNHRKTYCKKGCTGTQSVKNRKCVICGQPFSTIHNAKTCGNAECKRSAKRIRSKSWTKQPPKLIQYETRECKECGELFSVDSRMNNVYCSKDCRRKAENRRSNKRIPKAQRVDNISLKRLYKRDSGICYICGGKCDWNSQSISKNGNPYPGDLYPVIEHVIPISKGGLDAWDNVRLAHWKCNLDKLDGLIDVEPMSKEVAYSQKFSKTQPKRTAQYSLDGKLIRIWDSTAQIRRELGLNDKHIQNVCCRYKSNTGNAYGYHWEYVDDKNGDRQINTA